MKYFYDCEFIEDGKTIDIVSIGITAGDGRELYMQSVEFDASKASPWVYEHVLPQLASCPHAIIAHKDIHRLYINEMLYHRKHGQCTFEQPANSITGFQGMSITGGYLIGMHTDCPWHTRAQMKREVLTFMDIEAYGTPELWADYGAYDHVAFCQLFGTMMDLPAGFPMYTHEFQQVLDERGITDEDLPQQQEGLHNALADALHLKKLWGYIVRNDAWQ